MRKIRIIQYAIKLQLAILFFMHIFCTSSLEKVGAPLSKDAFTCSTDTHFQAVYKLIFFRVKYMHVIPEFSLSHRLLLPGNVCKNLSQSPLDMNCYYITSFMQASFWIQFFSSPVSALHIPFFCPYIMDASSFYNVWWCLSMSHHFLQFFYYYFFFSHHTLFGDVLLFKNMMMTTVVIFNCFCLFSRTYSNGVVVDMTFSHDLSLNCTFSLSRTLQ